MLQNWLILLPELSLLGFILTAVPVNHYRVSKTPKTFFTLCKVFLLITLLSTVIFYNKSAFPDWWKNTSYTTLFKTVIYLISLLWFYLSSKWFLNKDRSSFLFYILVMGELLFFELLLSAQNLLLPAFLVPLICWFNWLLLKLRRDEEKITTVARLCAFFSALFTLLLWGGVAMFYTYCGETSFAAVRNYLQQTTELSLGVYVAAGMIMASLLFMLAAAPFHSCFIGIISTAVLPVCGFITLIPPFVFLSCLINLMVNVFGPLNGFIRPVLLTFGTISLLIGALSANSENNMRRLFAFSSVYNIGFMLFSVVSFNGDAVLSAFAYTVIYVLAMAGVYTVFLGIKSRGEYLVCLKDISGLSVPKPYISAAILVFMVSLIGIPPLLGFLGRLSVINNLIVEGLWSHVIVLLLALLFMANAYLQVIRTIYFETPKNNFDRTDKAIYISLFINLVLVMMSILNPGWLLNDAEKILRSVF